MDEMAHKWRRVGQMLKFSASDIQTIISTHQDDVDRCERLLTQWLQGHNDHNDSRLKTWKTLLEVLRDARLRELADKLDSILSNS